MQYLNWENISQIAICIFGILAIILISRKNKWGFVCGLASQPFWYITTYHNHQWGIMLMNVVYTGSWIYGIYQWFYKKP
ncbi:MAG: nicotinamide mononucleotide transporter [Patescibacteria group bacterium]